MSMHHPPNALPTSPGAGALTSPAAAVHEVTPATSAALSPAYGHPPLSINGAAAPAPVHPPGPPPIHLPQHVPLQQPTGANGEHTQSGTPGTLFSSLAGTQQQQQQQEGDDDGTDCPPRKRRHTSGGGSVAVAVAASVAAHEAGSFAVNGAPLNPASQAAGASTAVFQAPFSSALPPSAVAPMTMEPHQPFRPRAHTDDFIGGFHHRSGVGAAGGGIARPQIFGGMAAAASHPFDAGPGSAALGAPGSAGLAPLGANNPQPNYQHHPSDDPMMLYHSTRSGDLFTTVVASREGFHQGGGKKRGAGKRR